MISQKAVSFFGRSLPVSRRHLGAVNFAVERMATRHFILAEYAADQAREGLLRKFSETARAELEEILRFCEDASSESKLWRAEIGFYAASQASLAQKSINGTTWHRRILWLYDHARDDEELALIRDDQLCCFEPKAVELRYQRWHGE